MSLLAYRGEEQRGRSVDLVLKVSEGRKTKTQWKEVVISLCNDQSKLKH